MAKHSKEEIINKGIELMRKNGYHGTGVQQVLKECHIPKGSFYHFFESKQDFALQAIDQYADDTIQHLMSILSDQLLNAKQKLTKFFKDQLRFYKNQNFEMTCLMSIMSFEVGSTNKVISRHIKQKFQSIKILIAEIVEDGQSQGLLRDDLDSKKLADYLIDGFNGALITMKYEQSSRGVEQFLNINMKFIDK